MSREAAVTIAAAAGALALAGRELLVGAIDGWVWPVPIWRGRRPVISDGFSREQTSSHRKHLGVDVMYQRRSTSDLLDEFPVDNVGGTKWFVMPGDVPAIAAHGGRVWSAQRGPRGWNVVLDHGPSPYATFYTHLSELLVEPRVGGAGGPPIAVGQPVGIIGGDPSGNPIRHLHFELWLNGAGDKAVDPSLVMKFWGHATLRDRAVVG